MFLAIIWALLNLVPRKDDERVRTLAFTNVGITATVKTSFIRVTGVPLRILPLQYGNVVRFMAKLPEMEIRASSFDGGRTSLLKDAILRRKLSILPKVVSQSLEDIQSHLLLNNGLVAPMRETTLPVEAFMKFNNVLLVSFRPGRFPLHPCSSSSCFSLPSTMYRTFSTA